MFIVSEINAEVDRGVDRRVVIELGFRNGSEEELMQELGRLASLLDDTRDSKSSPTEPRELTPEEERDVDMGWTTPASRRARDRTQ